MSQIEFAGFAVNLFDQYEVTVPSFVIFAIGALGLLLMLWYYFKRYRSRSATIKFSDIQIVSRANRSRRHLFRSLLPLMRVLALAFLLVAFARPRAGTEISEITSEGVDIMMVLDISSSMQAEDFKPHNRLYVAKEEIKKFITKRLNDRIGLVVFSRYSFTQCPLTVDYDVLLRFVDQVGFGLIEDGTAIGMAIATGVNRLRETDSKSRIMILLTDGDNNAGEIDPVTASNLAGALGIRIYTIGAGKTGNAMMPYQDPVFGKRYVYQPTRIDEKTLQEIAERTGGRYFRARSGKELEQIYDEIDKLEKTEVTVSAHTQYTEMFEIFVYGGMLLLLLEIILANTYLRKLP